MLNKKLRNLWYDQLHKEEKYTKKGEREMEKQKVKENIIKIFWIFIIGSIIGYLVEMVVALVQNGHFESRQGLIYGPFAQVYGIGMLAYYFTVPKIKGMKKVFLFSMVMGGIVEYICSYVQEKCFGTISWDYSHLWFNISGRTSLLHCTYWGFAGVLFIKYVYPRIQKLDQYAKKANFQLATSLLAIFMVFNITVSCMAAGRQLERRKEIAAKNNIDYFFDKYYPDYVMNEIYANKITKID